MNQWLGLFLIAIFVGSCNLDSAKTAAQFGVVFPSIDYDKVVIYQFSLDTLDINAILKSRQDGSIKKQKELSLEQTRTLLRLLNDKDSYGEPCVPSTSFNIGIVFYKENNSKAYLSWNTNSGELVSYPQIRAQLASANNFCLKQVVQKQMISFFKELGFR